MTLTQQLQNKDLILGSQSPRRKALMEETGLPFRVMTLPVEETFSKEQSPADVAIYLSRQKAQPFKKILQPHSIVVTADTIVVKDHQILNKASDSRQAFEMLKLLNATHHQVITGVCITSLKHQQWFAETTIVHFAQLTNNEIQYYIDHYQPFDKAGAYGIQEWIGSIAVEKIEGSYHNVVGLPIARLYKSLKNFLTEHP